MADNGKRVMVVDDAGLMRRYYREALERGGFLVDEALNGLEALEKVLQGAAPDLLVVDINMPQMDGLTFVHKLRAQEGAVASTPVLITSTESEAHDIDAARAAGANFYFTKPVTRELLVECARLMCGVRAHE